MYLYYETNECRKGEKTDNIDFKKKRLLTFFLYIKIYDVNIIVVVPLFY